MYIENGNTAAEKDSKMFGQNETVEYCNDDLRTKLCERVGAAENYLADDVPAGAKRIYKQLQSWGHKQQSHVDKSTCFGFANDVADMLREWEECNGFD